MNKVLIILIAVLLVNCNMQKPDDNKEEHITSESVSLGLDNGSKWKLDNATRVNISEIKILFTQEPSENTDFGQIAEQVRANTNKLVSECRMTGPAHEVLHVWLNKFIEHQKEFNNNAIKGISVYRHLQSDLAEFEQYFE